MKSQSLFDRFIEIISQEVFYDPTTKVQPSALVHYGSYRKDGSSYYRTARSYAIATLVPGLVKKFIGDTSADVPTLADREGSAILEFLEDNTRCKEFNKTFDYWILPPEIQLVLGEAKHLLWQAFGGNAQDALKHLGTVIHSGPGSSVSVPGLANAYFRMGDDVMSFTSKCVRAMYKVYAATTPLSYAAELVRSHAHGSGDLISCIAKFTSVAKNNLTNRGICTQPSGNMIIQLGFHECIVKILKVWFFTDISAQQPLNQNLALLGSRGQVALCHDSWEFCTLDLSRASNFPLVVARFLLPEYIYRFICVVRSPSMEIGGKVVRKHMCSTMGNGFTFSLMTLLLSAIVQTVYKIHNIREFDIDLRTKTALKTWAVYGDDIIVDKRVVNHVISVLTALGFIVNEKKSFTTGLFKESCGADFYDGYPVRPVYVEKLDTDADIYSLVNRLQNWSVLHSYPLPESIKFLLSKLSAPCLRVPHFEDVTAGLHVPHSYAQFDKKSSSFEYEKLSPRTKTVLLYKEKRSKAIAYSPSVRHNPFVRAVSAPSQQVFKYTFVYDTVARRVLNEPALLLFTLGGDVRNGKVGVRSLGAVTYTKEVKVSPTWTDPTLFLHPYSESIHSFFVEDPNHARTRRLWPGAATSVYNVWEYIFRENMSG